MSWLPSVGLIIDGWGFACFLQLTIATAGVVLCVGDHLVKIVDGILETAVFSSAIYSRTDGRWVFCNDYWRSC